MRCTVTTATATSVVQGAAPRRALSWARLTAALLVGAGSLAGYSAWQDQERLKRATASVEARRELAQARLAPAGTAPRAGVSARAPIRVTVIPDRLARRLSGEPDFQRLSHRCGVCHVTPDPALRQAAAWPGVVDRMAATIAAAGLLPLPAADRAAVLRVLTAYSSDAGATPPARPVPARQ